MVLPERIRRDGNGYASGLVLSVTGSTLGCLVGAVPGCPRGGGGSGNARTFNNCTEAWNAGAAPLRRGDPGYSADLDRDGDGVACEVRPR